MSVERGQGMGTERLIPEEPGDETAPDRETLQQRRDTGHVVPMAVGKHQGVDAGNAQLPEGRGNYVGADVV